MRAAIFVIGPVLRESAAPVICQMGCDVILRGKRGRRVRPLKGHAFLPMTGSDYILTLWKQSPQRNMFLYPLLDPLFCPTQFVLKELG